MKLLQILLELSKALLFRNYDKEIKALENEFILKNKNKNAKK